MPKVCALCSHPKRSSIDRFLVHGHSFKEFVRKFPKSGISVYVWSRHRNQHIGSTLVEADGEKIVGGLSGSNLKTIHRSLRFLAARQAKIGKPAAAIAAYSTLLKAEQMLADRAAQEATTPSAADATTVTEIEVRMIELLKKSAWAEWMLVCLHKAGHRLRGRLENTPNDLMVQELESSKELRERVRHCLIEADNVEIPAKALDYVVPGTADSKDGKE
jgi:hypothetical protein